MAIRLVQLPSSAESALIVIWLAGHKIDADIRAAAPGACIMATTGADDPLTAAKAQAAAAGWRAGPMAFVGYSAGCQAVRRELRAGADPSAVLVVDGTHASWPTPERWQIEVWRRRAERARAGERLFVATCTDQLYTEALRAPETPYMSTLTTLRRVTEWSLEQGGGLPYGAMTSQGALHVHHYASARIDAPAHRLQQTAVLPAMLRLHVAPWLARARTLEHRPERTLAAPSAVWRTVLQRGDQGEDVRAWQQALHEGGFDAGAVDGIFGPVTKEATRELQRVARIVQDGVAGIGTRAALAALESREVEPDALPDLGMLLLACARADLGQREEPPGSNNGPFVRMVLGGTGTAPPANYCAAALRYWLGRAATSLGVAPPILGSVGAKATMAQLQRARRWFSADEIRANPSLLRPGMIPVWDRSDPDRPETAWWGHIGVASETRTAGFLSVEANSGNIVAERPHLFSDTRWLGAGWVDAVPSA